MRTTARTTMSALFGAALVAAFILLSAGSAAAQEAVEAPQTFFDYFIAGGKLMWAILACSIVALAFVIERSIGLRRDKVVDDAGYEQIMRHFEEEGTAGAQACARANDTSMGRVVSAVLSCASGPRAEMESILEDSGARELWELQRNTKPLGIISNVAPLLGLLGTVVGIIRAFSDVATEVGAIGNPRMLATGIYEALITTAAGLTVAIPVYLLHHYFRSKAEVFIRDIEGKSLSLIAAVFEARGESGNMQDTRTGAGSVVNEST